MAKKSNTEIIIRQENFISDWLKEQDLSRHAVRQYEAEEFKRSVVLAIAESPDLQECLKSEKGQRSLYNALRRAAALGLSLNPQEGKACLVAYSGAVNYQIMKNGMVDLLLEGGIAEYVRVEAVRSGDKFKLISTSQGDDYSHEIAVTKRGEVVGFYALLSLASGKQAVKYMSMQEIEEWAGRYKPKGKDFAPLFVRDPHGYGKKTVIKSLVSSITLPKQGAGPMLMEHIIKDDSEIIDAEVIETKPEKGHGPEDIKKALKKKKEKPEEGNDPEAGENPPLPDDNDLF